MARKWYQGTRIARPCHTRHRVFAKARLIAGDVEDRSGQRALLNLGHSFAHAIESEAGLGTVLHGEAVAIGMVLALRFSADLGLCDGFRRRSDRGPLRRRRPADAPRRGRRRAVAALLKWIARDKKNDGASLTLILARGIGQAFVARDVDAARLAAFLA